MNKRLELYLPIEYKKSIFDIDYQGYFALGYRVLFFDLDNTIADYDTYDASEEVHKLFRKIKDIGFEAIILSNNKGKRVQKFSEVLGIKAYNSLMKPFIFILKKHLVLDSLEKNKILWIGDQLVTDILCASKLDIKSILVDPINKKSEKWYTKYFNRKIEVIKIKKIKKHFYKRYIELGMDKRDAK